MKLNACILLLVHIYNRNTLGYYLHSYNHYKHIYRLTHALWRNSPFLLPLLVLCYFPFHISLTYLETLLRCDTILSTLPQVTLELTSPSPSPTHTLPIPNSQHPRSIVRLTKTPSRSRLLMVRNSEYILVMICPHPTQKKAKTKKIFIFSRAYNLGLSFFCFKF
jgi:hypothetical protein